MRRDVDSHDVGGAVAVHVREAHRGARGVAVGRIGDLLAGFALQSLGGLRPSTPRGLRPSTPRGLRPLTPRGSAPQPLDAYPRVRRGSKVTTSSPSYGAVLALMHVRHCHGTRYAPGLSLPLGVQRNTRNADLFVCEGQERRSGASASARNADLGVLESQEQPSETILAGQLLVTWRLRQPNSGIRTRYRIRCSVARGV